MSNPNSFNEADEINEVDEIAVVGMAGRFPGAANVEQLWRNLRDGVESISTFSAEQLIAEGVEKAQLDDPNYVRAGAALADVDLFDASFFGFNPREAEITDPQHRFFLECAWEALESAGYDSDNYQGAIGVYAGVSMNSYLLNIYSNRALISSVDHFQVGIGNDKDFLPTRVSYKLNLKGPSLTVQTACSTSLVAVHLACQSLLEWQCDMALAGGVSIRLPQQRGYLYQAGGINSPDGHCRAFDAAAMGTVGGNGIGIVVLKRLADAIRDGDDIHAVIKGSAINNDGSSKVGYTAPSIEGQARVIADALAMAGVEAESIGYVEAHGTATPLGDPIEVAALSQAFRASTDARHFCALGSIKTNIGHLDAAAGVAGLIKAVLSLRHRQIPPSLHFRSPNPQIDFLNSPFYVNASLADWPAVNGQPRRAGVSSFGIGGTNAHLILEETPAPPAPEPAGRAWQLLVLSAKTETALASARRNLAGHLRDHPEANLADVAYTLQAGRRGFDRRCAVVCRDHEEAVRGLEGERGGRVWHGAAATEGREREVVWMFSGQGTQYVNMGRELYEAGGRFRREVERCSEQLRDESGWDLREVLYPERGREAEAGERLAQTLVGQPALFVVEYALAEQWKEWGVSAGAMIGHSLGEYVAACESGVMSVEDGLRVVAERGRLMQEMKAGGMLAVVLGEEEAREAGARHGLWVAAVNGAQLSVLSGEERGIEEAERELEAAGVSSRRLRTRHAFHSGMMEPVVKALSERMKRVKLRAPQIPYISNLTGRWITEDDARDAQYWGRQLLETVRFGDGISELSKKSGQIFLEIGPGETLSKLCGQQLGQSAETITSLRPPNSTEPDEAFLLQSVGKLWNAGVKIDWPRMYDKGRRKRTSLPTYPFERQRYWVEADESHPERAGTNISRKPSVADWFYTPGWKQSAVTSTATESLKDKREWLLFSDECGLGKELASRLREESQAVIVVQAGDGFRRLDDETFSVNPQSRADYDALLSALDASGRSPQKIVHLWNVTPRETGQPGLESVDYSQAVGFYSLLYLAQALGEHDLARTFDAQSPGSEPYQLWVVANELHQVTGEETIRPEKSTLLGPCRVISQEYPNITCRCLDVANLSLDPQKIERLVSQQLLAEVAAKSNEAVVAFRGNRRWIQNFEAVKLDSAETPVSRLREGGVYLITGGLGSIGLEIAEYIARATRGKLVLVNRSKLPDKSEWQAWLSAHDEHETVSRRIRRLQLIEAQGAEVLIASADVADREQMREVIAGASERFGEINGVVHAAGVAGEGLMQLKQGEAAARVLAPKVSGTLVLDDLLRHRELDFFILCSSIRAIQGGVGHVDYCAANAFLDAFAHHKTFRDNTFTVSINWGGWRQAGMSFDALTRLDQDPTEMLRDSISPSEGIDALSRILRAELPQVIVAPTDLHALLEVESNFAGSNLAEQLDRMQSSKPGHQRPQLSAEFVPAGNKVEQALAAIWQDLLGIEQVGIHDNFFELGGDSILSIQIIARANRAGLRFTARQVMEHQTIAALAAVADSTPLVDAEQGILTGLLPLTPIQHWFFDQHLADPHHWNQALLLTLPHSLDPARLRHALQALLVQHDALRLRFSPDAEGGWRQFYAAPDAASVPYTHLDLGEVEPGARQRRAIEEACAAVQASLDLRHGPLIRVAQMELGSGRGARLLLVIHHLAVDVVSWRMVMEDLERAYEQLGESGRVELGEKSSSYRQWGRALEARAAEIAKMAEVRGYWEEGARQWGRAGALPVDHSSGANTVESAKTVSVSLDDSETQALLQEVSTIYHAQINDVLLTALAQTFTRWTGAAALLVELEGHGREAAFEEIDLSRTVGWMTTAFPALLEVNEGSSSVGALRSVKEQLRQILPRGLSYGLLRYLNPNGSDSQQWRTLPEPEVGFLYLGQIDHILPASSLYKPSHEWSGPNRSPRGKRSKLFEIEAFILEGRLHLVWTYSEHLHQRATVEKLAEGCVEALRRFSLHSHAAEMPIYTPSDFPEAELNQQELDELVASLSEPDE